MPKREGRPPLPTEPLAATVPVRVTEATLKALRAEAERRGATLSEVVREAVEEYLR